MNLRINQILNKDTNKTFHNSINRNNSIEQQVNYDKLLKKKRKESIDCKKINSLDNEINDVILKEKESDDEINAPEVNDDYINEEISKKENLEFFNKDISLLEESYNKYYLTIPKEQIMAFNIKDNLMFYTKGIKPIFIIRKNNKELNYFCSLNYLNEGNNLHITNYSVNKNDEIKNGINELLKFLSVKKINYQNLTIDLYYENINDNIILNKEIDNIFRELKFKWIKLENLEGGIRYQKMKYINPNYITSNNINNSILNLTSGLIIYFGSDKMEKIINSKDFNLNLNLFNLKILEKIYENKTSEIENIKFYLNDLHYNQCSDLTEIIKLLSLKNIKLPSVKRNNFI